MNDRGLVHTESVLHLLHQANRKRLPLTLQLGTDHGELGWTVDCPVELVPLFREAFLDAYPGTTISAERRPERPAARTIWTQELWLRPDLGPIRDHEGGRDPVSGRFLDPVAVLCAALKTGRSGRIECVVTLEIQPVSRRRLRRATRMLKRTQGVRSIQLRQTLLHAATHPRWLIRAIAYLLLRLCTGWRRPRGMAEPSLGKLAEPLYACRLRICVHAPEDAAGIAERKLREIAGAFTPFNSEDTQFVAKRPRRGQPRRRARGFLLTAREVAQLWHPLTEPARSIARVPVAPFRELEPPLRLPSPHEPGVTLLGRVQFRQERQQFGIRQDDLRRHLLVLGKTGCGKSTLLASLVRQQVEQNRGIVLIDPHGQLADDVLDMIPKRRTNDVIVFDAGDKIAPVGFNPLRGPPGSDPSLIADGVLTAFQHVFGLGAGSAPRLLHIFRNCLLSLIGRPEASLLAVQRLLVDANYRKSVIAQVRNPVVRAFWETEFLRWHERERTEYIASLQNKLGAFTTNAQLQAILGATEKSINLRSILDRSQVLICNLSKGTVGHEASTLLGSLLLSSLHVAALSRADIPEFDRTDAVIVVDEFHSYLSEGNATLADALAESRKYRTSYVLATQLLEQLDATTLAGVLGNCGSTLCMTVGPRDAQTLTELLGHDLTPEDLMRTPKHHGYLRLLIDGTPHTFSMTTLLPPRMTEWRGETIRRVSRERFGQKQLLQNVG
jgi:energy-coupling factor transporter ATP-binding protein EcfA2